MSDLEKTKGVTGFHSAQDALEKVSERKGELDEMKGKTLGEISELVQKLSTSINVRPSSFSILSQISRNY